MIKLVHSTDYNKELIESTKVLLTLSKLYYEVQVIDKKPNVCGLEYLPKTPCLIFPMCVIEIKSVEEVKRYLRNYEATGNPKMSKIRRCWNHKDSTIMKQKEENG